MVCQFCGEKTDDLRLCDWTESRFVPMRIRDLVVGDVVRRFNELTPRRTGIATVVELQDFPGVDRRRVVLEISGPRLRSKVFTESRFAAIMIKREAQCEAFCCERCRVERGDEEESRIYCSAHWKAWEAVA